MSMDFLSSQQIIDLCKANPDADIFYRSGIDYRYTGRDGMSIDGYKRNEKVTLEKVLEERKHNFIELEQFS